MALEALLQDQGDPAVLLEVRIRRAGGHFELRHLKDGEAEDRWLLETSPEALRELAQYDESGRFRPLRTAPTLRTGWKCTARSLSELDQCLQQLYPGAVADWFAFHRKASRATAYRELAGRQTGMYRVNAALSDDGLRWVAQSQCHEKFCLKQRMWALPDTPESQPGRTGCVPCLEPCPLLMEFARVVARDERAEKKSISLSEWEFETLRSALSGKETAAKNLDRVADFSNPTNARRREFVLAKLTMLWNGAQSPRSEGDSSS